MEGHECIETEKKTQKSHFSQNNNRPKFHQPNTCQNTNIHKAGGQNTISPTGTALEGHVAKLQMF